MLSLSVMTGLSPIHSHTNANTMSNNRFVDKAIVAYSHKGIPLRWSVDFCCKSDASREYHFKHSKT